MHTVGTILRERRLEMGLSLQFLAQETRIAQKYLDALENGQHEVFPARSYLIGHLRVYSEYLGFTGSEIIQRFHNEVLQEQPVPIEELLTPPRKRWVLWFVIFILIGLGAGYFLYSNYSAILLYFSSFNNTESSRGYIEILNDDRIVEQVYTDKSMLQITVDDRTFPFGVTIEENAVFLTYEERQIELSPQSVQLVDFDGDGVDEMSAFLRDTNTSGQSAILRFSRMIGINALDVPLNKTEFSNSITQQPFDGGSVIEVVPIVARDTVQNPTFITLRMQAPSYVYLSRDAGSEEKLVETGEELVMIAEELNYVALTNGGGVELLYEDRRLQLKEGSNVFSIFWDRDISNNQYTLQLNYLQ